EGACAVEDDEQLLVGRMAVRWSRERPGVQLDVLQPRPARAGGAPEVAAAPPAAQLRLDVRRCDDRVRALRRLREVELRLELPGMRVALDLDVTGHRPGDTGTRKFAERRIFARAEGEHVEAVVTAAERVCLVEVLVDDAVARPDLVRLLVHPRDARAAEDVEDLLGLAVHMGRRRNLARLELDAAHAGARTSGGA